MPNKNAEYRWVLEVDRKRKFHFRPKTETESISCLGRHDCLQKPASSKTHPAPVAQLARMHLLSFTLIVPHHVSRVVLSFMPELTVPDADADNAAASLISSQYTVRLGLMTNCVWRTLASATQALWDTFGNHRIYQLQPAETESAPNVVRLLSAETRNRMST